MQTESAAVQNEVTGAQVQDQELNGRNPVYMVQFLPGVRGGTLGDLNFGSTGGPGKTGLARNLQLSLKFLF